MKNQLRILPALLLALLPLTSCQKQEPVVVFDLEKCLQTAPDDPQYRADVVYAVTSLQGLVNRKAPRLYILATWNLFQHELAHGHPGEHSEKPSQIDRFWLDYILEKGWIDKSRMTETSSLEDVLKRFLPEVEGLVLWDSGVPATANLACMAAGVENSLVMRHDTSPTSFTSWFQKTFPGTAIRLDLAGKFTGAGAVSIDGTTIQSCGSAKNDVYRWAIEKYQKPGLLDPHYQWYNCDGIAWREHTRFYNAAANSEFGNVKADFQHLGLYNFDYWIAKKAFIFDLSPWGDEAPSDDPGQPPGTDLATFHQIFRNSYDQRKGEFGVCAGFITWWIKYTDLTGGKHMPVLGEWEFCKLITSYNCVNDADAAFGLANASFFCHLPALERDKCVLPPAPRIEHRDGTTYVIFFMLDYDSSAWLSQLPTSTWCSKGRGKIPLNWSINPILHDRVPQVLRYLYETRTPNDFFGLADEGVGYLWPDYLEKPLRMGTVKESGIPFYERFAKKYFDRFALDHIAFYIAGSWVPTDNWVRMAGRITPDGYGYAAEWLPKPKVLDGVPVAPVVSYHHADISKLRDHLEKIYKDSQNFPGRTTFHAFRAIITPPDLLVNAVEECSKKYPGANVVIADAGNYFRILKQVKSPAGTPGGNALSVTLASTPQENGLAVIESKAEGRVVPANKAGRPGLQAVSSPGWESSRFLYVAVEDPAFKNGKTPAVKLEIDYYDEVPATVAVLYDSSDPSVAVTVNEAGAWKSAGTISMSGAKEWKTAVFDISDALFASRCNGADFRLQNAGPPVDFTIGEIRLSRKEPPAAQEKP